MANEICNKLDKLEGKKKTPCDEEHKRNLQIQVIQQTENKKLRDALNYIYNTVYTHAGSCNKCVILAKVAEEALKDGE